MIYIIERADGAPSQYFSLKLGADHGSPAGGWTPDREHALQFARDVDGQQFLKTYLRHDAPFCIVRPINQTE